MHQTLLQQSTPTTWCCHPRASRLGWCRSACKPPPFSSKHNDGHYGQTVLFLFHQTKGHFFKKYDLWPHVQLQTVVWLFLWWFWSSGFFLAERPFRLCRYMTRFAVDIDTFVPVSSSIFTRSFAVVLRLIFTFHNKVRSSRRQNASPSWAVWRLRGPMVFILAYYCLYKWTWYLQVFGNCSQGWIRLVEVYNIFLRSWLISFDFPLM